MFRPIASTVGLLLAILVAASTSPAHAQRVTVDDDKGDVWSFAGTPGDYTHDGSIKNADLDELQMRHRDRDLVVRAHYVELKKKVSTAMNFWFYVRTDQRETFEVRLQIWGRDGSSSAHIGDYWTTEQIDCAALRNRIRFGANTVRVRVPRSCIGDPRWIKVQSKAEAWYDDDSYMDTAGVSGPKDRYASRKPWTRRLVAG
jgi:hypothetical protein